AFLLRQHAQHLSGAAPVLAGQHVDAVALADLHAHAHQSTSGASEMIFTKRRARSSRVTGPKMRVPIGSIWLFRSTAAFLSNRMEVPSIRCTSFAVRTTTALWMSPFFTRPRGIASFT